MVIEPSGILAPGLTGRLTITSNLTSYGTIVMNIGRNPSGLTNDLIAGIRTNTYGGGTGNYQRREQPFAAGGSIPDV